MSKKQRGGVKGISNAEKIALRNKAVKRITELLGNCPLSVVDLARVLCLNTNTVYGYLRYMAEMGDARRAGTQDAFHRDLWELGAEDPAKLNAQEVRQHGAVLGPARQVGMWRDDLVAPLFGPARGAAS
jgi:hypothetical protein